MVSTKTLQRVLTHALLPIVAIYLSSVCVDVTQADVGYGVDKPTLLSRTPPFLPNDRLLFKREAKDEDENGEDGDEKPEAEADSRSGLKEEDSKKKEADKKSSTDGSKEGKKKKDDDDSSGDSTSKDMSEEKEESSESVEESSTEESSEVSNDGEKNGKKSEEEKAAEEKASEGSRHIGWLWKHRPKKHKRPRPRPPQPKPQPPPPVPAPPKPRTPRPTKPVPITVPTPPRPTSTPGPTAPVPIPIPDPPTPRTTPKQRGPTSTPGPPTTGPTPPTTGPTPPVPPPVPGSVAPSVTPVPGTTKPPATPAPGTVAPPKIPDPSTNAPQVTPAPGQSDSNTTVPNPFVPRTSVKPGSGTEANPSAQPTRAPLNNSSTSATPTKRGFNRPGKIILSSKRPNANGTSGSSSRKPHHPRPAYMNITTSAKPQIAFKTLSSSMPGLQSTPKPGLNGSTTALPTNATSAAPTTQLPSTKPTSPSSKAPTTTTTTKPSTSLAPLMTTKSPSTPKPAGPTTAKPTAPPTATTTKPAAGSSSSLAPKVPAPSSTGKPNSTNQTTSVATNSTAEPPGRAIVLVQPASMNANPPPVTIINGTIYAIAEKPIAIPVNLNLTRDMVNHDAELLLDFNQTMFDQRDLSYFLESHAAHSIHDPRVYFTGERATRTLVILSRELPRVPERLRFAYMVRVINELGRKIASKLNYYAVELVAMLKKSPDQLGNKPEVSMLVDAVNSAFESKEDREISGQAEDDLEFDDYMTRVIESSTDNGRVFRAAMTEISNRLSQLVSYFVLKATTTSANQDRPSINISKSVEPKLAILLGEALKSGAKTFILETAYDDRFRVPLDAVGFTNLILNDTISLMTERLKSKNMNVSESIRKDFEESVNVNSFKELNPISDKSGLIGSWNSFLFSNLGSSERLIKVFGSLLGRVPIEVKARWINTYISQVEIELERTISGFVTMQGMPFFGNASELFLLSPEKMIELLPNKAPTIRDNYLADKNRIPARCYLAGRRWRLALLRGLEKFSLKDQVLDSLANSIGAIKNRMMDQTGNDNYRLCLPRLEVGTRGWSIDGNPEGTNANKDTHQFPLKNPIDGLTDMKDPFTSGVALGFGIGVRVGYNEERNATLEMERATHLRIGSNDFNSTLGLGEVKYVAMASYRKAATVGGRKAFEIAVREGYLASLKISVRAGMNIPVEAGSRISALKSVSYAGQAGQEAGKIAAEAFILERKLSDVMKKRLVKVGQTHGLLAGEIAGESIGSIVGKAAAEEAYRRSIIRGGKVARAKFHLEEYEAGAKLGFEYGIVEGKKIASSSTLDRSAPSFFRLPKPVFSNEDKPDNDVDHWEKELIPPLTDKIVSDLARARNHTPVRGTLKGKYKVAKEVKKGFKRISYTNVTYDLEVFADGFIRDSIAYLTLNGTVNNMGVLKGSLIARDIFDLDQDQ